MARIEYIKQRLDNWGMWAARGEGGATGYATRSILAVDVWARGTYNGSVIPVFEGEAMETDRAITALKETRPQLVRTVIGYHLNNWGVSELAHRERCKPSTIHARLGLADQAIDQWLSDRDREREQARRRVAGSFTT